MDDVFDLFCDLVSNLKSRSLRMRRQAIAAIGKVADRSCTNILVDAINTETDMEVRASLIRTVGSVGTPNLLPFLETFLQDPDARCRSNTIEALGRFRGDAARVIPLLRPLLNDPDNRVVGTAIKVMHDLGDDAGVSQVPAMLRGPDLARRCTACWVVGEVGLEEELPTLIDYLGSPNYRVHTIAAGSVKKFGTRAAAPLLAALPAADRFRRAYIALSLGDCGAPEAVPRLLELVKDPDELVCLHALTALARVKAVATRPAVEETLASPLAAVRQEALKTLKVLGDRAACPAVVALLKGEGDARVLSAAAALLGALGSVEHIELLRPLLHHADARTRANAVEALGRIGDRKIVDELRPFLSDPDNRVFANAAIALYEFGDVKVVDLLTEKLRTGDERVRMSVAYALGEIPLESVVQPLVSAAADQSALVRERVVKSLLKKGASTHSALQTALAGESPSRRALGAVETAAGKLGLKSALAPLLERFLKRPEPPPIPAQGTDEASRIASLFAGLKDRVQSHQLQLPSRLETADGDVHASLRELASADDARLRCFSVYTLGELKVRESLGTVLCLLQDPDDSVRAYAAEALAKVGDWRVVRFLEGALGDSMPAVRLHAARALAALGGPGSVAALEAARSSAAPDLARELDAAIAGIHARSGAEATV